MTTCITPSSEGPSPLRGGGREGRGGRGVGFSQQRRQRQREMAATMQHLPEAPAAATCISPAAAPPPRAAAPDRPVEPGHALLARDADEGVHGALVERGARGLAHFYAHVLRLQPRLDNPERVGDEHRGRARAGRGRHVHRRRLRPARVDARADGHLQPLVRRKVDLGRRGGEAGREEETHGVGSRGPGPFLARAGRQSVTQVPPRSPPSLGAAQTAWARAPYTAPARPLPALSWRGRLRRAEQGGAGVSAWPKQFSAASH